MKNEYVQSNDLDISCNVASDFGIWKTFKKISGIYNHFLSLLYYMYMYHSAPILRSYEVRGENCTLFCKGN